MSTDARTIKAIHFIQRAAKSRQLTLARAARVVGVSPSQGMSRRLLKFNGGSVDDYAICRAS